MKTYLASLLVSAAAGALAAPAVAGPDAVTPDRPARPLAASDADREITPTDDVVFLHDSYSLQPEARQQLLRAAEWLRHHGGHRLVLEGYTDDTGTAAYNEELASWRAAAARDFLEGVGVPADRIVLVVFGEATARPGGHPLDRRVVVYATDRPAREIAEASLARRARHVAWTADGKEYAETRTGRVGMVVGRK